MTENAFSIEASKRKVTLFFAFFLCALPFGPRAEAKFSGADDATFAAAMTATQYCSRLQSANLVCKVDSISSSPKVFLQGAQFEETYGLWSTEVFSSSQAMQLCQARIQKLVSCQHTLPKLRDPYDVAFEEIEEREKNRPCDIEKKYDGTYELHYVAEDGKPRSLRGSESRIYALRDQLCQD